LGLGGGKKKTLATGHYGPNPVTGVGAVAIVVVTIRLVAEGCPAPFSAGRVRRVNSGTTSVWWTKARPRLERGEVRDQKWFVKYVKGVQALRAGHSVCSGVRRKDW